MEEQRTNNKVLIGGEIVQSAVFSHEVCGEGFFEMIVATERLSGVIDTIPVIISERLMTNRAFRAGESINLIGQFRSHNKLVDGKSKLFLSVFACEILSDNLKLKTPNKVILTGYACKPTIYRTTPFGRDIADVLVAVNRSYNKSDYIPCIVWGRNARFAQNISVGEKVAIVGRIQSREYQKRISDDIVNTYTVYEVSVSKILVGDNIEKFNFNEEFEYGIQNN